MNPFSARSFGTLLQSSRACLLAILLWSGVSSVAFGREQPPEASPVAAQLAAADAAVAAIIAVPDAQRTYENTLLALDDVQARLYTDTAILQFLQYVSPDASIRAAGERATQEVTDYLIVMGKREDVYNAVNAYASTNPRLEGAKARLLEFTLRDYRRAGMGLPKEQRSILTEIEKEISKTGIEFEKNIREDNTQLLFARDELRGVPDELIRILEPAGGLLVITMDYPVVTPLLENCEVESTRQKVWIAYRRRAPGNVAVLERLLKLRHQAAAMLGYASPADFETEVLMAKNAANVAEFYSRLRPLVREKAQLDYQMLREAKRERTKNPDAELLPWDYAFYKNQVRKQKYKVDPQTVKEHFPADAVIEGLFRTTRTLYGLAYKDITTEARAAGRPFWYDGVQLFEVRDAASGALLGEFYLDLYPRENKYKHFAQWGLRERKTYADGTSQTPLAALVCNFPSPTSDAPSLMSHEDVETFFHEFGHCLHTILTTSTISRFSGTSVERDFVEAPSQMFENWVWNAEVLGTFSRHYKHGGPLPRELLDGMLAAKHLGSGIDAEQQFYYGMIDMAFHTAPNGEIDTVTTANTLFGEVTMFKPVRGTFFHAAFGHLVGYQAGYYGYQWSQVYAADMFTRFKERGLLNPDAGRHYRETVLSRGGTQDGLDLVRACLGRAPDMKAYMEHLGLVSK